VFNLLRKKSLARYSVKEFQKRLFLFKPSTTWRTSVRHHPPFGSFFSHWQFPIFFSNWGETGSELD